MGRGEGTLSNAGGLELVVSVSGAETGTLSLIISFSFSIASGVAARSPPENWRVSFGGMVTLLFFKLSKEIGGSEGEGDATVSNELLSSAVILLSASRKAKFSPGFSFGLNLSSLPPERRESCPTLSFRRASGRAGFFLPLNDVGAAEVPLLSEPVLATGANSMPKTYTG